MKIIWKASSVSSPPGIKQGEVVFIQSFQIWTVFYIPYICAHVYRETQICFEKIPGFSFIKLSTVKFFRKIPECYSSITSVALVISSLVFFDCHYFNLILICFLGPIVLLFVCYFLLVWLVVVLVFFYFLGLTLCLVVLSFVCWVSLFCRLFAGSHCFVVCLLGLIVLSFVY